MSSSQRLLKIILPDGSEKPLPFGATVYDLALSIGKGLAKAAVGAVLEMTSGNCQPEMIDIHTPLYSDAKVRILTVKDAASLAIVRHSTAHLLACAVHNLYPGTQVTIGPATADGFYYDFAKTDGFRLEDLPVIEKEMHRLVSNGQKIERRVYERSVLLKIFKDLGEHYKCELIESIPEGQELSVYALGSWFDLCKGPHVPSTEYLQAFRLTHVAGAYWRGDEKNAMLSRIYGVAFWKKADLDAHFVMLEEAQKRDHRRLGKELDLFSFHSLAPAMPFFHAKGTKLYNRLLSFMRQYYDVLGFEEVITPQIFDVELFKRSGHYQNYKEDMFFCQVDEREFGVKPMNCPGHTLLYAEKQRSYRDLPIRFADFGRLHRYERSGVTAGLTRVRSFCQDDAHIFCTVDGVQHEIKQQIFMLQDIYEHFGFSMQVGLSLRPTLSLGREEGLSEQERHEWDELWQKAEGMLQAALDEAQLSYSSHAGDGAFYGPKIDCQVKDAIGRMHQLGTIQLDFALPKRFDLSYIDAQSSKARPVMVHRAIFGSIERFMGILLEHTAGDLPVWLAPVAVRVLTLNDALQPYGQSICDAFRQAGIAVEIDRRSEKLGFKIREAQLQKIPFMVVVGEEEQRQGSVALRSRKKGDLGKVSLDQAIACVLEAVTIPRPGQRLLDSVVR